MSIQGDARSLRQAICEGIPLPEDPAGQNCVKAAVVDSTRASVSIFLAGQFEHAELAIAQIPEIIECSDAVLAGKLEAALARFLQELLTACTRDTEEDLARFRETG